MPVRFSPGQHTGSESQSTDLGRETPLPQYERTQSVPFTLNLQEDPRTPGQFQLVVNISPNQPSSTGIPLNLASRPQGPVPAIDALRPTLDSSKLYQTQKSSPPSTPLQDKQGWSDLDALPPQFLDKVVPDWNVTFSRSDSTASTQSKRLSDIRARIKRKGKGYVVRLLKGSTSDTNEIAEVELGQHNETRTDISHELDSSPPPTELDSAQAAVSAETNNSAPNQAEVFEIGTSNEPGIERPTSNPRRSPLPVSETTRKWAAGDRHSIRSIPEEYLSDAETLIPDVYSIRSQMNEEQADVDSIPTVRFNQPVRSASVSSIVKTPTRGLSVVGPVRRVGKTGRARGKTKSVQLELKRSDAHKSIKRRSPRGSMSNFTTGASLGEEYGGSTFLRERLASSPRNGLEHDLPSNHNSLRQSIRDNKSAKPRHTRRMSADDAHLALGQKSKLKIQTNVPRPRSTNVSPVVRRKQSQKKSQPTSSSSSSIHSAESTGRSHFSPKWSEVDASKELRDALGRAFKSMADSDDDLEDSCDERVLPPIVEPKYEGHVGEIPLPPEVEIGSFPGSIRSPAVTFWGLAITALANKVHEGFETLRDMYGTEPPVQPGHVRVRWTCVR